MPLLTSPREIIFNVFSPKMTSSRPGLALATTLSIKDQGQAWFGSSDGWWFRQLCRQTIVNTNCTLAAGGGEGRGSGNREKSGL